MALSLNNSSGGGNRNCIKQDMSSKLIARLMKVLGISWHSYTLCNDHFLMVHLKALIHIISTSPESMDKTDLLFKISIISIQWVIIWARCHKCSLKPSSGWGGKGEEIVLKLLYIYCQLDYNLPLLLFSYGKSIPQPFRKVACPVMLPIKTRADFDLCYLQLIWHGFI